MDDIKTFKQKLEEFKNGTLDIIAIHPEIMKTMRDEYYNMSRWEWFVEGFRNIHYILDCYDTVEHFPDDFWEGLSWGWMTEYIYPYDDPYNPYLSPERKLRLGRW